MRAEIAGMVSARVAVAGLAFGPDRVARCLGMLDPREIARADRFLRDSDRQRFIASHAALRIVLAGELGIPPGALHFEHDDAGRPFIATPGGTGLDFNLSHSGDLALIGLVAGARIGVDVEVRRTLPDAMKIARGHFAPDEAAALEAVPAARRGEAFFALWTRKEAVVKALGAGLSLPLAAFSVTTPPAPPRMLRIEGGTAGWSLAPVDVGPDACATVAVMAAASDIRADRLPGDWPDKFHAK